jgi:hypothetical protein
VSKELLQEAYTAKTLTNSSDTARSVMPDSTLLKILAQLILQAVKNNKSIWTSVKRVLKDGLIQTTPEFAKKVQKFKLALKY